MKDNEEFFKSTGTMNEKIDYPMVLLMQINRIAQSNIFGMEQSYIDGIDDLECFVEPSKDTDFKEDIEKLNEIMNAKINKSKPLDRGFIKASLSKEHARLKLGIIMKLVARRGLLPTDEWSFES